MQMQLTVVRAAGFFSALRACQSFSLSLPVSVKWSRSATSPIKSLGSYSWCYIREGITAISNLHTHTKCMTKLKCCAEEPCFLPHHTPLHCKLAFGWQCLHDSINPTTIQVIILKLKEEVCKGRNICPFLHPAHWLPTKANHSSNGNPSPDTAVKFTPAWLWPQTCGTSSKSHHRRVNFGH